MAEFVELEAMDVDLINSSSRQDEGEDDVPSVSDNEFIDDSEQPQSDYSYFTNVTRTFNDTTIQILKIFKILMRVTISIVMTMKMNCIIFQILKQKLDCFVNR